MKNLLQVVKAAWRKQPSEVPATQKTQGGTTTVLSSKAQSAAALPVGVELKTAATEDLRYWHACGNHIAAQAFLRQFDFDYTSEGYKELSVGFNNDACELTFAVDATHYCAIKFCRRRNEAPLVVDVEPVDDIVPADEAAAKRTMQAMKELLKV